MPYLTRKEPDTYAGTSDRNYDDAMEQYRTAFELIAKRIPESKALRSTVRYGGSRTRGEAYDRHITGFNAFAGSP